jgi:hypothetical protein
LRELFEESSYLMHCGKRSAGNIVLHLVSNVFQKRRKA